MAPEEYEHWLGKVRPATKADAGWAASAEGESVLAAIHARLDSTGGPAAAKQDGPAQEPTPAPGRTSRPARASGRRRGRSGWNGGGGHSGGDGWVGGWSVPRRGWALAAGLAAAGLVVGLVAIWPGQQAPSAERGALSATAGAPAANQGGGAATAPRAPSVAPTPPALSARPVAKLLSATTSCDALLSQLRKQTAAHVTAWGLPGGGSGIIRFPAAAAGSFATTVVPDALGSGFDTSSAADANSQTNVQEAGVDEPDVVKTDGDRVVAVTGGVLRVLDAGSAAVLGSLDLRAYAGASNAQLFVSGDAALVLLDDSGSGMYGSSGAGVATFLFVDLTGAPRVTGSLSADGDYLDARMVGTVARVVAQSSPVINFPPRADNEKDSTAKANNQKAIREAPIDAWLPSYTVTVGADSAPQRVPCGSVNLPDEFTGASLQTVYTIDLAKLGDPDYLADPAAAVAPVSVAADGDTVYADAQSLYIASNPSWYDDGPNPGKTELHRFAISGAAAPLYLGSGAVPGRLLSSYSLSEYDGYLRIVTTSDGTSSNRAQSDLYVLNAATLDRVGHVGGLGRGQRLYAVRFTGPRGYVVTFRQTDPLYVLDLSDPRAPKLAGELHITGYSDYLYDAGDNRLIGVGQEADRDGRATGMQVSLFDVSDPAAPKRAAQVTLPGAIGWGQLNPHAFLCWQPTGLVVAPVDTWSGEQSGKVLALRLQGLTLTKLGLVANPLGSALRDDGQGIQRSLLVAGQLWTLSGSGVRISDPGTLAQLAWSPFS